MGDLVFGNVNISNLTDVELYKYFEGLGESIGPIVGTTRRFYEKRLYNLLQNGNHGHQKVNSRDSDVDVVDEEPEPRYRQPESYNYERFEDGSEQIPTIRARTQKELLASLPRDPMRHSVGAKATANAVAQQKAKSVSRPKWATYFAFVFEFVVVAILCAMGYYFYADMKQLTEEEQRQASIKRQIDALNNE